MNIQLSENFWSNEFKCPCGCGYGDIDSAMLTVLQDIRTEAGFPMTINSGCRCLAHNESLEASRPTSAHLTGLAVDIACANSRSKFHIVRLAIKYGVRRIGIGKNFVHLDVDGSKDAYVMWSY